MALLQLRKAPDPVLLRKTSRVSRIDASIQKLIDDMFETMYAERGVGLAANQVGGPLRILVMGIPEGEGEDRVVKEYALINAEFVKKSDEELMEEGCLSIPGYRGQVKRFTKVKVKALDRDGKEVRISADGLLAQALQHEIDHLDGVLYVDRMKEQGTLETLKDITREDEESPDAEASAGA
jgi:peptide deformylase